MPLSKNVTRGHDSKIGGGPAPAPPGRRGAHSEPFPPSWWSRRNVSAPRCSTRPAARPKRTPPGSWRLSAPRLTRPLQEKLAAVRVEAGKARAAELQAARTKADQVLQEGLAAARAESEQTRATELQAARAKADQALQEKLAALRAEAGKARRRRAPGRPRQGLTKCSRKDWPPRGRKRSSVCSPAWALWMGASSLGQVLDMLADRAAGEGAPRGRAGGSRHPRVRVALRRVPQYQGRSPRSTLRSTRAA